jgi:large subunit ribosomal protein L23
MKELTIEPVITETSVGLSAKNWYTFKVPIEFNKNKIKEVLEKMFTVNILSIKTITVRGKTKRSLKSRKLIGKSDWKKAIVKVKEGQKISAFDLGGI